MRPPRLVLWSQLARSVSRSLFALRGVALGYVCLVVILMSFAASITAFTSPAPSKSAAQPVCSQDRIAACRAARPS